MTRRSDWQTRLAAFLAQRQALPFAWGSHDCCMFAAGAVNAITGHDYSAGYAYASAEEAASLLEREGDLAAFATRCLGEPIAPALAAVGDVVLVANDGRQLLAVCNGTSALAPGRLGLVTLGMDAALAAWRV